VRVATPIAGLFAGDELQVCPLLHFPSSLTKQCTTKP
jgi:hypothetical protein